MWKNCDQVSMLSIFFFFFSFPSEQKVHGFRSTREKVWPTFPLIEVDALKNKRLERIFWSRREKSNKKYHRKINERRTKTISRHILHFVHVVLIIFSSGKRKESMRKSMNDVDEVNVKNSVWSSVLFKCTKFL